MHTYNFGMNQFLQKIFFWEQFSTETKAAKKILTRELQGLEAGSTAVQKWELPKAKSQDFEDFKFITVINNRETYILYT